MRHWYNKGLKSFGVLGLLTVMVVAGCGRDDAPVALDEPNDPIVEADGLAVEHPAADPADAEFAEDVVAPEALPARSPERDMAAVRDSELTVDNVRRYGRAVESVHRAVTNDPELQRIQRELDSRMDDAGSVREVEEILNQHPAIRNAIREAGFSTEDYLLTGAALYGAYMYVTLTEQGMPETYRPDYVTDAHIRFIRQNRAEVEAVVQQIMEVYGADMDM